MSTHRQDEIDELTAEARHAYAASLQREVGQLRIVKEGLRARVKDLEARIAGLDEQVAYYRGVCEEQALAIHIHEKGAGEQAATERTLRKRIAELEASVDLNAACFKQEYKARSTAVDMLIERDKRIADLEASQAKRTQLVVDATLRKAGL